VELKEELWFRLEPHQGTPDHEHQGVQNHPIHASATSNLFGDSPSTLQVSEATVLQRWPMIGISGTPVADLLMATRKQEIPIGLQFDATTVVIIMLTGAAGLIVLLVQGMVIAPLGQFRTRLHDIVERKAWNESLQSQRKDEIGDASRLIDHLLGVVQQQVSELELLSQTDTLTGLANRRAYNERLDQALARQRRQGLPVALVLMDVDHFKRYNDTYGHPAGDRVLQHIAAILRQGVRQGQDLPVRLGGEEFGLLLENTNLEQAAQFAERMRTQLEALALEHRGLGPDAYVTLSLGVAEAENDDTPTTLYHRADEALYQAKAQGRNRVVMGRGPLAA